jgi:hypothetical protein
LEKYTRALPLLLFVAYIIKMLAGSPSISDAAIVTVLGALVVASEYRIQTSQYQILNEKMATMLATIDKNTTDISSIRDGLSSVRMLTGIKTQNFKG